MLAALYEKGAKIPSPKRFPKSVFISQKEIHTWVLRNKEWFMNSVSIVLLDE